MALDKDTLAAALAGIAPQSAFPGAANELAGAYGLYMKDAASNGVDIVGSAVDGAATAMAGILANEATGLSSVSTIVDFDLLLVASMLTGFWAAMVNAPGAFLPGATFITPPTSYATLATALDAVLAANLASKASQEDAMDAIATVINGLTTAQPTGAGTATFPGPTIAPIL